MNRENRSRRCGALSAACASAVLASACAPGIGTGDVDGHMPARDGGAAPGGDDAEILDAAVARDGSSRDVATVPLGDAASRNPLAAVCDGSDGLRLFYISHGYRPSVSGSDFMSTPGVPYVIVDGRCRLYVRFDMWDPITVRTLDEGELTKLFADLDVASWKPGSNRYCMFAYDAPLHSFGAPGASWQIEAETPGGDCPPPPMAYLSRVQELASRLRPLGRPVDGKVNFSLVPLNSAVLENSSRGAMPWPLGPVEVSVTDESTQFRTVDGEAASRLRALREQYLRGELGSTRDRYIPIEQNSGARYELRMRDTIPLENEQGRLELRVAP